MNSLRAGLATRLLARLLEAFLTFFLVITAVFFLLRFAPGGPFDSDHAWPAETLAHLNARYGLDAPLATQYLRWSAGIFRGDLQESLQYFGKPVVSLIAETLPTSLALGGFTLAWVIALGVLVGVWGAWSKSFHGLFQWITMAGVSLPSYLAGTFLVLIFALSLGWLPAALWDEPTSWILPSLTLGVRPFALVCRLVSASVLEQRSQDYVRTARAQGLSELRILLRHVLANALLPVLALFGSIAAHLLTGSFLVETLFQIPGTGKYFVSAVLTRDYPLVCGMVVIFSLFLIAFNWIAEILTSIIDPTLSRRERS